MIRSMSRKVLTTVAGALMLSMLAALTPVEAQEPSPPARFFGTATLEGRPAPNGTAVVATIGATICGEGVVTSAGGRATYSVDVLSASSRAGCGVPGAAVAFAVGRTPALQKGAWQGGMFIPVNLDAVSATPLSEVAEWGFARLSWEDGPRSLQANAATRLRLEFFVVNRGEEALDFSDSWAWDLANRTIVDVASASRGRVTVEYAPPPLAFGTVGIGLTSAPAGSNAIGPRGAAQVLRWGSYQLEPGESATLSLLLLILPMDDHVGEVKTLFSSGVATARGVRTGRLYAQGFDPLRSDAFGLEDGGRVQTDRDRTGTQKPPPQQPAAAPSGAGTP